MSLEEQLNLARLHFNDHEVCWFEDLVIAIMMSAGAGPSIYNARRAVSDAFRKDLEFKRVYRDNIACKIMDFERKRHAEPSIQVGPMSSTERNQLAEQILDLIFSE